MIVRCWWLGWCVLVACLILLVPCCAATDCALFLSFDGTWQGEHGESPWSTGGTFVEGIVRQALHLSGESLIYDLPAAFNSDAGTIMMWFQPDWNGDDRLSHRFMHVGSTVPWIWYEHDGAGYYRVIHFEADMTEWGVGARYATWEAGDWYHLAATWSGPSLRLYLNGECVNSLDDRPSIGDFLGPIYLGSAQTGTVTADGAFDEVRIWSRALSDAEVHDDFTSAVQPTGFRIDPRSVHVVAGETAQLRVGIEFDSFGGRTEYRPWTEPVTWETLPPGLATVDANGVVHGLAVGAGVLVAQADAMSATAGIVVAATGTPDLDVGWISRTPRYPFYKVEYDPFPVLANAADKHYPDEGETVTFTAHVFNQGDVTLTGFQYAWHLDDELLEAGDVASPLAPGASTEVALTWAWESTPHDIAFSATPPVDCGETVTFNNRICDRTTALSFRLHVAEEFFDAFNRVPNSFGSKSCVDWKRMNLAKLNDLLAEAVTPETPQGCVERVRLDDFVVLPRYRTWLEEQDVRDVDCMWRTWGSGLENLKTPDDFEDQAERYADPTNERSHPYDKGYLHECGHQLGLIDIAVVIVEAGMDPYGGGHAFYDPNRRGTRIPLMGDSGGPWTSNSPDGPYISTYSAIALNRYLGHRRGYYGEYLYDIPQDCRLRIVDVYGDPVPNAEVAVYQRREVGDMIEVPELAGTADAQGMYRLPNLPVGREFTTETGHRLHPNPFGNVYPLGVTGTFLYIISACDQISYHYRDIYWFNQAYVWDPAGATDEIHTRIIPDFQFLPENVASNRPVMADPTGPECVPEAAVDGVHDDVDNFWWPGNSPGYIQVDLGEPKWVYKMVIWPRPFKHQEMFNAFHILGSPTGDFSGEETELVRVTDWNVARARDRYPVDFVFAPTQVRWLRLVVDLNIWWGKLYDWEVYAGLPEPPFPSSLLATY